MEKVKWECFGCDSRQPCMLEVLKSDGKPTKCPYGITIDCYFTKQEATCDNSK